MNASVLVNDRLPGHRDSNHGSTSCFHTLLDGGGHFLCLPITDADPTIAVANDNQGGEAKATSTLDDLGDPVDLDDALVVLTLFLV